MVWRGAIHRALHQHAAAVHRVKLAPGQVKLAQPVQRAGDGRLGDIEFGRQAAHCVRAFGEINRQKHAKLAGRKIRPIAPDQRHHGIAQHTNHTVGL